MSKANQKFVQADDAVSPVIGVILMVAITVVLAAVVFVLVSNLSKGSGDAKENAAVKATSPVADQLYITLLTGGQNAPYSFNDVDELQVIIDGVTCDQTGGSEGILGDGMGAAQAGTVQIGNGDEEWDAGETIILTSDCTPADLMEDSEHVVSVILRGTVILDNVAVEIKST